MFNIAKNIIYYNYDSIKKYKGYFVNDIHYKIFVNSIVKKRDNLSRIYFVITKKQVYSIYITLYRFSNIYVMGFDGNKIFINKINSANALNNAIIEWYYINGKEIAIVDRRDDPRNFYFFNLDYDFDIIDEFGDVDEIEINKVGSYRVQGDLILIVRDYEDYERTLNSSIVDEIANLIENIMANRILNILNYLGLTCEQRNGMVTIVGSVFRNEKLNNLVELKIVDIIKDKLYIDDILSKLTNANITTIKHKSDNELYILIEDENRKTRKGLFANNYYYHIATILVTTSYRNNRIEIHCRIDRYNLDTILRRYKDSIFYNIINNYINNIQNIELNMGNHHIRIENTLANTFSIVINNIFNNNNFVLNIRLNRILVTPQTRIRIDHREHGTIYIKFKNTFSIEFRFTAIDEEFIGRMNRYILKEMLKTKTA